MENKIVDHLFRHQHGKMIAVFTKIFGLAHLQLVEDALQDTFIKASIAWRNEQPENPEAWLMKAARNRIIDLIRKIRADKNRYDQLPSGPASYQLNEHFLDHEVEDSQLRMIFVACHPFLAPEERIAFALKTISGFSMKEIAAALLQKEETIKKRLSRARKTIVTKGIQFEYPSKEEIQNRMASVLKIIYLIFNEGFHSTKTDRLISKDLCGEGLRLAKIILKKESLRSGALYALFALMCFHASRLDSRVDEDGKLIDIEHQERTKWHFPLIVLGNDALNKAFDYPNLSAYHFEATIAGEHIRAQSFDQTNWNRILELYQELNRHQPSNANLMNMAIVHLQMDQMEQAKSLLESIDQKKLGQRAYLLTATLAEYYRRLGDRSKAISFLENAIKAAPNEMEKKYLEKRLSQF